MAADVKLHSSRKNLAGSDPVIIPYMILKWRFITLYGIITGSLSAKYEWARYKMWTNSLCWKIFTFFASAAFLQTYMELTWKQQRADYMIFMKFLNLYYNSSSFDRV